MTGAALFAAEACGGIGDHQPTATTTQAAPAPATDDRAVSNSASIQARR
jgi:hypothetical protein